MAETLRLHQAIFNVLAISGLVIGGRVNDRVDGIIEF
jgi:hypothetical protein